MSDYRINVRFHDDNEEERRAAEYLKTLHRSRNQFVVDAVLARMDDTKLLDNIRQIFREEVVPLSIAPVQPVHQTVSTELTEEQKEENRKMSLRIWICLVEPKTRDFGSNRCISKKR